MKVIKLVVIGTFSFSSLVVVNKQNFSLILGLSVLWDAVSLNLILLALWHLILPCMFMPNFAGSDREQAVFLDEQFYVLCKPS